MDLLQAIHLNLVSPQALFFVLGVFASVVKSDLKLPEALYQSLTIYLLAVIGFKGGVALSGADLSSVAVPILAAVALSAAIPLWAYPILRRAGRLSVADSASIAAHYGSVSAVTFTVATSFLARVEVPVEGHATALLAVMESPAIVVGILLGRRATAGDARLDGGMSRVLHEALFGKSVLLLIGALAIGFACGERGMQGVSGFFVTPFQGVLALFLLELGLVTGRRLSDLRRIGVFLIAFGVLMPVVNGALGAAIGAACGLSVGGTAILATLAASASYIAAPAAMRLSLPEANPTLSLTAALAITFPFNVTFGIPLYLAFARALVHAPS